MQFIISRFHHPIWTNFASTVCVATGVGLLWLPPIVYGWNANTRTLRVSRSPNT
jgi:hypothetical protein